MNDKLRRIRKTPMSQLSDQDAIDFILEGPGKTRWDGYARETEQEPEQRITLRGDGRMLVDDEAPEVASQAPETEGLAKRVARKLKEPGGNPTMTVKEAAHAFSNSPKSIYRWLDEGK
jgi:hypothetical protein